MRNKDLQSKSELEIHSESRKAVFFDVDGVIRENNTNYNNMSRYYCLDYKDVNYLTDIFEAHKFFQEAGYKIFWVTMQNCIKEGKISETAIHNILINMVGEFENQGIHITDYQICQSKEENDVSKIQSKVDACNKLAMVYGIDLSKSIGIGDREADILAYKECGMPIRIQAINRYGDKESDEATDFYCYFNYMTKHTIMDGIISAFCVENFDYLFDCYPQVDKLWGKEFWIVNDTYGNYCSKILKLIPEHQASLHYHANKHETFTVFSGLARITSNGTTRVYSRGESVRIEPNVPHRFEAFCYPAYILETSTLHSDDDVIRIEVSK